MFRPLLMIVILIFGTISTHAQTVIEPIKSKRALFYLPFDQDLSENQANINLLIQEIKKNYKVEVVTSTDIENRGIAIYNEYILGMSKYDFIYFNTHGSSDAITLGLPRNQNINSSLHIDEINGIVASNVHSNQSFLTENDDIGNIPSPDGLSLQAHTYSITPEFFDRFNTPDGKFRNAIIIMDCCYAGNSLFQNAVFSVGCGFYASWDFISNTNMHQAVTHEFVKRLSTGMSTDSALIGLELNQVRKAWVDIDPNTGNYISKNEITTFVPMKAPTIVARNASVVLYSTKNTAIVTSDANWLSDIYPYDNTRFALNLMNYVHGQATLSKKVKFYDGCGGSAFFIRENMNRIAGAIAINGLQYEWSNEDDIITEGYRAIFIVSPGKLSSQMFSSLSIFRLKEFVKSGGRLVIVSDVPVAQPDCTVFNQLLANLGIEMSITPSNFTNSTWSYYSSGGWVYSLKYFLSVEISDLMNPSYLRFGPPNFYTLNNWSTIDNIPTSRLIFGFNGTRDYIFNIVAECKVDD
jgi:hypothetical protein